MSTRTHIKRGLGAATAFTAVAALVVPAAHAAVLTDAYPTPQAIAARAEFLAQAPAPPNPGTVCVIDTGVTPLPDTESQIVERIAIDGGDPGDVYHSPADPFSGHGTFVAATIASQVDGHGSAGIWPHAKIISIRVFSRAGVGATAADYRAAIAECVQPARQVDVITISLSAAQTTPAELVKLEDRITEAVEYRQINVVASTGADGSSNGVNYPARFPAAFAVGATDPAGAFCGFSNRGEGLDLSALGCAVVATAFDGRTGKFSGTSFSTPSVAAILVALRTYKPGLTARAAEQMLLLTAQQTAAGPIVDAAAAFRAAGLGELVDAYQPLAPPPLPSLPAGSKGGIDFRTEISPFEEVRDDHARAKLKRVSYNRGVLRVKVARPPHGGAAIFRVGGRSYQRSSGKLTLRVRSWRTTTVAIENEWGVRSVPLKVRQPATR